MRLTTTLLLLIFSILTFAHSFDPCTGKKGEYCEINLMQLKPTQMNVGKYEVSVDQVKTCFNQSDLKDCFDKNLKPFLTQDDKLLVVI